MKIFAASLIIILLLLPLAAESQGVSPSPPKATPSPSGGSSGGDPSSTSSSRRVVQLDLDSMIGNMERWKQNDPAKFERLKNLLHIPFVPPKEYKTPTVLIWYPSGKGEITRNEKLDIYAYVKNDNPMEVRSDVYLALEVKGPDDEEYIRIGGQRIILANQYDEKTNATLRDWSGITPFSDSQEVGAATFRIWFNDMHKTYFTDTMYAKPYQQDEYYSLLELDLVNSPPEVDEESIRVTPLRARYNDPIRYEARFFDTDGDMINVLLHILDDQDRQIRNLTQIVTPGTNVTFIASQYGLFGEEDAGKNFSYFYSFDDGLDGNSTGIHSGPSLIPSPKIFVSDPQAVPADENRFWWQNYRFSLQVKNPEVNNLRIDLYTSTPSHPNRYQETRVIGASEEAQEVVFEIAPFFVSDADQSFEYYFRYSATDQNSREGTEILSGGRINPKIVKYPIYSAVMIANILAVLLAALVGGIVIERRFYR
ncbi:hypothetical protein [Candidatus Methanocrinis natronophilus]|uniref:Uncharacterized protein n=1 Tax=Candidatus Methanocrinis natronophilus TaxID=3033396 RepID=A0ABT5X8N6_9EURY|nr:hypothetical protein [Candidatus Methanocrinis natronophilus]MDF0591048.1 hypothetical protein [Candidatus Methanocrinis natronophilus]